MTQPNHTHVAILGSGAAGLTAAIYASRARLEPVVFHGHQPGGQLTITTDVENFPGFEHGIMGPELMQVMTRQAERFGTRMVQAYVSRVELESSPKVLHLDDGSTWTADTVIVGTGASARLLGLESESHLMGYGVSACATCDGFFFTDKKIVVVGGGDSAMEEATFLAKFASEVTIIHRRDSFRASQIMQERALNHPKIKVVWNKEVTEVLGDREAGVTAVRLRDTVTSEVSDFPTEGLFLAIGHVPNTGFLGDTLEKDESGYLVVEPGTTRTRIPGVFAAGDVADKKYRQAITAAGTGCMAALDAEHWLTEHGLTD
ncbi:MAG: thioredoxin-disulfide reductase [Deltaproteobacteria bacterium]|nr:MAG: thioredoxin-disulfide reductase [Deltaproteobacteria bacterium]